MICLNSIIELIGRIRTMLRILRAYGKDYFTIYDFVKAHHHFIDPEWDGCWSPSAPSFGW